MESALREVRQMERRPTAAVDLLDRTASAGTEPDRAGQNAHDGSYRRTPERLSEHHGATFEHYPQSIPER